MSAGMASEQGGITTARHAPELEIAVYRLVQEALTNAAKHLLERSLGEVKRRTKVIGRFPGETSCLTLVWAVLDLYIGHATNGIKFTQLERQRFKRIR